MSINPVLFEHIDLKIPIIRWTLSPPVIDYTLNSSVAAKFAESMRPSASQQWIFGRTENTQYVLSLLFCVHRDRDKNVHFYCQAKCRSTEKSIMSNVENAK